MIEMYRTIFGIPEGFDAHSESISWPRAAPSGFARLATAVALVRPLSENQSSLYRVGAQRQKGCANPMRIWPNIASPKMPPFALVPAYLSQLPTSRSVAVMIIAGLGPPLFKIQITMLGIWLVNGILRAGGVSLIFLFETAIRAYLRANSTEGKEIASAHPVNSALRDIEVLGGCCRDGREG